MKNLLFAVLAATVVTARAEQRELFVDKHLIESMENVRLELAQPQDKGVVLKFDKPWEYAAGFVTVIKDGDKYRMYYRGGRKLPDGKYDNDGEVTLYAESPDGITWTKPGLGLHAIDGKDTNIILTATDNRVTHNFSPLLDDRPGVPPEERFKAVGGKGPTGQPSTGLVRYVSADGIHWKVFSDKPLFPGYALDSLNVLTWVPEEQCYAIYLRTWSEGGVPSQPKFKGIRTISRSTSKDFVNWTEPTPMNFGDTPLEHLYTNNTQPYFRAPQILISMPFRFWPDKRVYSPEELTSWGVSMQQTKGLSDAVFMTSRGGNAYDRTFMESFVRPTTDKVTWHARETQPSNGVVPITEDEMSFYVGSNYTAPNAHLRRYGLRTDGFSSVHAGYTPGMLRTKPLTVSDNKLQLNYSTSAAGSISVQVIDAKGQVAGTSEELVGNSIDGNVAWKDGFDLAKLAGQKVQLKFTMKDADLYALAFVR